MPDPAYTLAELCSLAGVTPRTVRYYVAQGILRSPGTSGPGARYDDGHLARLRLVRRLQREHLPLAEIRARLAALNDDEAIAEAEGPGDAPADSALDYVRTVLGSALRSVPGRPLQPPAPPPPASAPAPPPASSPPVVAHDVPAALLLQAAEAAAPYAPPAEAVTPDRSHWERFALAPDVELHVRRPLTRSQNRAVARLLEAARQILEEDQP